MNFFIQLKESVVDFGFYRKIKDNRFSKSFVYLLLLLLIIVSIGAIKNYVIIKSVLGDMEGRLRSDIPEFALKNGQFTFEGQMPYYIANEPNAVVVIDTTGQTAPEVVEDKATGLLITQDTIYINNNGIMRTESLSQMQGLDISKSTLLGYLPRIPLFYLLLVPLGFIFQLGWKLLNVVILAVIGLIFNSMQNTNMPYKKILNISIYALTLPLLLQLAANLGGFSGMMMFFVYWITSIVYVYVGIKNCKEDPVVPVIGDDTSGMM